jgi:hypothetical protein
MQKYWDKLTMFLRQAGAPLHNHITEQALKKMAILHRKNALFYKTQNGARVGDLFMSLIHTCQLRGPNPFDYLTELQNHRRELFQAPRCGCPGTIETRSRVVWRPVRLRVERRLRVDLRSLFKRFMRQESSGGRHVYALREGHLL